MRQAAGSLLLVFLAFGCSTKTGPEGPAGLAGPQGATGAQGPQGPVGAAGQTGLQGSTGPSGPAGAAGAAGANGAAGAPGISVTSAPLDAGNAHCPNGGASFLSANGITWACNGAPGVQGTPGPGGDAGLQGTQGVQGVPGNPGSSVTSAALDAGDAHCAFGGSAFTSVSGTTYACNGAPASDAGSGPLNHGEVSFPTLSTVTLTWSTLTGSTFTASTSGGPLLVYMKVFMLGGVAGSHSTCQPLIDGQWAGTYGGLPNPGDPFWKEGLLATPATGWAAWSPTRLYPGVPAGTHTFAVQCATDTGTTTVCDPSVGCSWGFVEL